ncbi:MAG: iron ABC transporter permease [Armatimonadetes bacterium]|nr:iron ABC transporter permease [Armatimonadota bacterium]
MNAPPRRYPLAPALFALGVLLLASAILAWSIGDVVIAPATVIRVALHAVAPGFVSGADESTTAILLELRLPRIVLAALTGAALAVAGTALQGLTGNPLADPYTVGVSSGASVGASAAVLLGISGAWHGFGGSALAFATALLTMGLVFAVSRVGGRVHTAGFLLAGIVVGSFLWSITTLLMSLAHQDQAAILRFLLGRFSEATWGQVALLAPVTLAAIAAFTLSGRGLDSFAFGEETARSVGVNTEAFKAGVLALSALLTAASVAFAGIIGFVGLLAPHIARALVGSPHRGLVGASALVGAILCVLSDLVARTVMPGVELPVGVVTALLGAPFFAGLLRRQIGT